MRKILLLGGSFQQIIAIQKAKEMGYYTILCDYLPDNPGQYEADVFYQVSTVDKETILKIAKKENINGILAYASDPAAPTAAYIQEKLSLPGNPYKSVEILCNKDLFREFLKKNGFCTPVAKSYSSISIAKEDINSDFFTFPVLVKPVDSSGSKGISTINDKKDPYINDKLLSAFSFSRKKRIIIEEYVEKYGYQIAGDGLSIDGKLVFRYFGNDHFDSSCENPFVPIAASFPCNMPKNIQNKVHDEIQRLISLLEMKTCTYNFDLRIDKNFNVYLMEVAPRDGGNYIPQVIKYATGVDLVECSIKSAMGEEIKLRAHAPEGYYSYFSLHSKKEGILKDIMIDKSINIIENHINTKEGEKVKSYTGANTTLGCLIIKFKSMEEMLYKIDHFEEWQSIIVE